MTPLATRTTQAAWLSGARMSADGKVAKSPITVGCHSVPPKSTLSGGRCGVQVYSIPLCAPVISAMIHVPN